MNTLAEMVEAIEKIAVDPINGVRVIHTTPNGDAIVRVRFDPYDDGERLYLNRYRVYANGEAVFHRAGF